MCKTYGELPNSPFITEMDPVLLEWSFHNWQEDQREQAELAKNTAYLLASFWNPEAVKQILQADVHQSTDEEFEESSKMVREINAKAMQLSQLPFKKRKKRKNVNIKG